MYLESLTLSNFRKYGQDKNMILFAYEKTRGNNEEEKEVNISTTTTLIIGKNNVGKTTAISALKKLEGKGESFNANDFNFSYLNKFLEDYIKNKVNEEKKIELPEINFKLKIKLDDDDDIISNVYPILFLDALESGTLNIKILMKEAEEFIGLVDELLAKTTDKDRRFKRLLDAIDEVKLETLYYDDEGRKINNFKLGDLIEVTSIEANTITQENSLTKAFNKIIKFRYTRDKKKQKGTNENVGKDIDDEIDAINNKLTDHFKENHEVDVNESLAKIEHVDTLKIKLTSDLNHDNILDKNSLMYEYVEKGLSIPENQYGLGYTNLVMIIAQIIEYIEKSPKDSFTSKINIISIEEPETYMHPQMQELFIRNINAAIEQLLESREKYVNSQIIITTHSSHIVNSKIHSGDSFNYMNYLTVINNKNVVVNLQDETIVDGEVSVFSSEETGKLNDSQIEKRKRNNLMFLKKHIKYKVSELFFSDAVIFVEGITEEILLKHWIDQDQGLHQYYISIFNINGAHGLVYHNLITQLQVPALIITDLDIKMNKLENCKELSDEKKYKQVDNLIGEVTTNQTLIHYIGEDLGEIDKRESHSEGNLYVGYQKKILGYYPTSFEEAIILSNYKNDILKNALKNTKPQIYKKNHAGNDENLKEKSRLIQHKLSKSKSEFTNNLLFELIREKKVVTRLEIPNYIHDGLKWLGKRLKGE